MSVELNVVTNSRRLRGSETMNTKGRSESIIAILSLLLNEKTLSMLHQNASDDAQKKIICPFYKTTQNRQRESRLKSGLQIIITDEICLDYLLSK